MPSPPSERWRGSRHTSYSVPPTAFPDHVERASYSLGGEKGEAQGLTLFLQILFTVTDQKCTTQTRIHYPTLYTCPLTVTAEVAVFAVDPLGVCDDPFILTIFTLAHDVVDPLKLLRTGQATHKIHFALRAHKHTHTHSVFLQTHSHKCLRVYYHLSVRFIAGRSTLSK